MIRERRTKSGKLLEVDFFPVWEDGRRMPTRAPKTKKSTEEQAKYNKRQAEKKLIRLVNANFDTGDIFMHPTYAPGNAPQSDEEARRDIVNYFRRVKRKRISEAKRIKELLKAKPDDKRLQEQLKKLEQPFKYIYVIEKVTYKTGKRKGYDDWHFHAFLTGGIDRDTLEDMWPYGMRTNADRYQPEKFGPESAAKYVSKDPQGSKRFCYSKNLTKPDILPPKDGRISAEGVMRLATLRIDDNEYWERKYKGYHFIKCYSRYNEYNGHWYVSVIMYKTKEIDIKQWEVDEWITEF